MIVKLWETENEGPNSKQFSTRPKGDNAGKLVWLPFSQIRLISQDKYVENNWTPTVVSVNDWLAKKVGL